MRLPKLRRPTFSNPIRYILRGFVIVIMGLWAFGGVMAVIRMVWSPDRTDASSRAFTVVFVAISTAYIVVGVTKFDTWLTAKRDRLRRQAEDINTHTIESHGKLPEGMFMMRCPACKEMVDIEEINAHVEAHQADLRNPAHNGIPVAALLRHPSSTEWKTIYAQEDKT
jgi:hypothetical protein